MTEPTHQQIAEAIADAVETLGGEVTDTDRERFAVADVNFTAIAVKLGVTAETVLNAFIDALAQVTGSNISVSKRGPLH